MAPPAIAAPAADHLHFELRGTRDAAADDGEARTREEPGIYCWWSSIELKPGYFKVVARARTIRKAGTITFVLTDRHDDKRRVTSVSRTRSGHVSATTYAEIDCGTFHFDGSFGPRLSDWSSPGLMVDWVRAVPVATIDLVDVRPDMLARYEAPRLPQTPVIDGDLGEWARVPAVHLGAAHARSAAYDGTRDLSANWRVAWDERHLYFACEVVDDEHGPLEDVRELGDMWRFDGIQIAFDGGHNARTPGYDSDDYEYGLGMTSDGPRVFRWVAGHGLKTGDVPTIDLAVVRRDAQQLTCYEAALPFKELVPFSPERRHCGMTLIINDCDPQRRGSTRAWMQWTPGIAGAKDPSAFGELVLLDTPPQGDELHVALLARGDLSGESEMKASCVVQAPERLGACAVHWSIRAAGRQGGEPAYRSHGAVDLEAGRAVVDATIALAGLGNGRFVLQADLVRDGRSLARAAARFVRFDSDRLAARLADVEGRLDATRQRIRRLRTAGRALQKPRAMLGSVIEFARFARDDLKERRYERAERLLTELETLLVGVGDEITAVEADRSLDHVAPPLPPERVSARDGNFQAGGEPQLLYGFCGWWRIWDSIDRLAAHGLVHLQDSIIAPFALFPDSGDEPDADLHKALRWGWEWADKAGICYARMIASDQIAGTFSERYPDAAGGGWGGSTLHPDMKRFMAGYLATIAEAGRRHRSTGVYVLAGEVGHRLSEHPLEVAAWTDHLRQRYGSIAALNATWGTGLDGWDAAGSAMASGSAVAWHDRARFNHELHRRWMAWMVQQVRAADPQALYCSYPSLLQWDDTSDFSNGIDIEALCRTFNVNGFDTASADYGGARWAMSTITGLAMPHDMARAFNPANPNFDPELHLVNQNMSYPPAYVRAAMFQAALHGMDAANLWVFQRNEGMDSMLVFQPQVMDAYIRVALDLRRLTPQIIAFQEAPAQAALLYAFTSVAYEPRHLSQLRAAYEGTFFHDAPFGFVTERTVLAGGLEGVRVLVLAATSHVPADVADAIHQWIRGGGRLVTAGPCLLRDASDRPLPPAPAGARAEVTLPAARGPDDYRAALEPVLARSIERPLRAVDADGRPLHGVELRSTVHEGKRLFYAINMNKTPVHLHLSPAPGGAVHELIADRALALPRALASLEVIVASIEP